MEKKLKKSIINSYGLPSLGFQLMASMETFYFAAFLTDSAKIPIALAGIVMMVTSIFDIVWVPTSGIILEKSNMKWENTVLGYLLDLLLQYYSLSCNF